MKKNMILQNTGLDWAIFLSAAVSCDQSQTCPRSCSPFKMPMCMLQFSFLLASSHHLLHMNFNYFFLLLSAYSEGPLFFKPPDIFDLTSVTVCPNSSCIKLHVLAPVLSQNKVFELVLAPSGVLNVVLIPSGMLKFGLTQNEVFNFVLPQDGVFKSAAAMSNNKKFVTSSLSNVGDRSLIFLLQS